MMKNGLMPQQQLTRMIKRILQFKDIETGGDLFGLWQNGENAYCQYWIMDGPNCKRTSTSFFQDLDYLSLEGRNAVNFFGLCHIGQWHSHHRIGLYNPSCGDDQTVTSHMESLSLTRFFVVIANINDDFSVSLSPFLYVRLGKTVLRFKSDLILI